MKDDRTELLFIIDKSGSMYGLEDDTVGGFNSMLKGEKEKERECHVTTIFFDHRIELVHDRLDIRRVPEMKVNDYRPGGATALLDAMGYGIRKIAGVCKHYGTLAPRVLVVVITDGYENASVNYSSREIKAMVETEKKYGWEFIFLGAGMDVEKTAREYGIDEDRTAGFISDKEGVKLNFNVMARIVTDFCNGEPECHRGLDAIREDREKRGKKKMNSKGI